MKSGLIVMPGTESKVEWESEGQAATRVSTANPSASSQRFANSLIADQIARSCGGQTALWTLLLIVSLTVALLPCADPIPAEREALLPLLVFLALAAAAGYNLFRNITWRRDRYSHPALVWPELGTPQDVESRIDRELPNSRELPQFGRKLGFTDSFFYCFSPLRTDVIPRMSILWAYTHITTHTRNGLPIGRSCHVHIHARNGRKYRISVWSESQAHDTVTEIGRFAPWATIGYNFATKMAWHTNREAMIREVDTRRAQMPQVQQQRPQSGIAVGSIGRLPEQSGASAPRSGPRHWWTQNDLVPAARPIDNGQESE